MTIITGDMHGDFSKLSNKNMKEKPDYVIITGDFGNIWTVEDKTELYWKKWLSTKPFEVVVLLGNHENFNRIYKLPIEQRYGNTVYKYSENIYILQHGLKYIIEDKSYFVYGGATSIDKIHRKENITWWKEEVPEVSYERQAWKTLEENDYCFDYVLSHTAPRDVITSLRYAKKVCPVSDVLQSFSEKLKCKKWFFGHLHTDRSCNIAGINYQCLYETKYTIEEERTKNEVTCRRD